MAHKHHIIQTERGPIDSREATTSEAGKLGGKRTSVLIEEGKLYEREHAKDADTPDVKPRRRR